ncbi:MAG: PIG-L family deacetylase, partial [Nitrospinota bacterium]
MAVHAHADDECSGTGGLFIRAAQAGHKTVLVTCTNGEMGEAKDPRFPLNPRDDPEDRRRLIELRAQEQAAAVKILGIARVYTLGYRDSGMAGWDQNKDPGVFANADLNEVARRLVRIIREHRPEAVVTYNEKGGYGHPDHIMAHRATMAALEAAENPSFEAGGLEPWRVRKVYYTAWARRDIIRLWKALKLLRRKTPLDDPDFRPEEVGTPEEAITTRVDVRGVLRRKRRALYTYRSQMGVWGIRTRWWWLMSFGGRWIFPYESFVCVRSDVEIHPPE